MPLRVTLNDIALACGVGKSTVARVLSNNPRVAPETRDLVNAKARELGYQPDPSLRVLAQHRWNRPASEGIPLALLSFKGYRFDPAQMIQSPLEAYAGRFGYRIEPFEVKKYPSLKKLGEVLVARGIRGLIVPPVVDPFEWNIDWSKFFVVGCGMGEYALPIHNVGMDFFSSVRLCWQQCRARGYRRIGAALFRQRGADHNDALRHAGILYEQSLLPPGAIRIPIHDGDMNDGPGFAKWFKKHRPDAVIALHGGTYWSVKALVPPPDSVAFCVVNYTEKSPPNVAGSSIGYVSIAEQAVKCLDQLIRTNEIGLPAVPDRFFIEPTWVEGKTLPYRKL